MTLAGGPLSTPGGRSERSFAGRTSRGHQSLTFASLPSASPSGVPSAGGCCPRRPHSQRPAHRGCAGRPAGWLLGPLEDARLRKERGCPRPHPPSQAGPLEPRFPGGAAGQGAGSPTFWVTSPGETDPLAAESDLGQKAVGVEASSRGDAGGRGWPGVRELRREQASGVVGRPPAPPHRGSNVPLPAICCCQGSDPGSLWRGPQCGPQKLGLGLSPHSAHPPRCKAEIWGPGATPGPSGLGRRWGGLQGSLIQRCSDPGSSTPSRAWLCALPEMKVSLHAHNLGVESTRAQGGPTLSPHVVEAAEPSEPRGGGKGAFRPPRSDPLPGPSVFLENRAGTPGVALQPRAVHTASQSTRFSSKSGLPSELDPVPARPPRSTLLAAHTRGPLARGPWKSPSLSRPQVLSWIPDSGGGSVGSQNRAGRKRT